MISGANSYYALDVVKYSTNKSNIAMAGRLVELFSRREPIPDEAEFPKIEPHLESYEFPRHILTEERLEEALRPERIHAIKAAISDSHSECENGICIKYFVPWHDSKVIQEHSVDMILSQAVLEHVDDLEHTYEALSRWLGAGGLMSHQIDFKCHGLGKEWNGHWTYSDRVWRFIRGKRPYLLNREPLSTHLKLMAKFGFEIVSVIRTTATTSIQRRDLALRFRGLDNDDLTTSSAFIQALKK